MKEMKAKARHLLTERKKKKPICNNWEGQDEFYSHGNGRNSRHKDYRGFVDNLKYESGPKTGANPKESRKVIKIIFETNLLTGSRWTFCEE